MNTCLPLLLFLSLQLILPASAYAQTISSIEIPVRIPFEPLYLAAEETVPRQSGHWRNWKDTHGIMTRYRAWRGPLLFHIQGDVLWVRAHVRYWVRARKQVLGTLDLNSSCGVNEPPRQAVIGVQIHLGWGPDWMLRPVFRIMPTRFLDRCEMTFADIDVTPIIEKEFQKQLRDKLRTALRMHLPAVNAIRQQAEKSWSRLQRPLPFGDQQWLLLNPQTVALSPVHGRRNTIDTRIAIHLQPRLVTGQIPEVTTRPLPPLARFYPRSAGLIMRLAVDLDFTVLSQSIASRMAERPVTAGGREIEIQSVAVTGKGQKISVQAQLGGTAAGMLKIEAVVVLTPEKPQLRLENLDYQYTPDDPMLKPQADLFHGYFRKQLEAAANQQLQLHMLQWKERLLGALGDIIPAGTRLDVSSLRLRSAEIDMDDERIRLEGQASGHASLELL